MARSSFLTGIGVLFGLFDAGSPIQGIATIPEFLWELSLGIYLHWLQGRHLHILAGEVRTA